MKKIISIILITILCISLAGCGNSQPTVGEQQPERTDMFSSLPDTVVCVVQISVNPEFEIHITDDGVIENAISLNDDAQNVCNVVDIKGRDYKDGMMELLTTAYNQGYITQDSRVSLVAVRKSTAQYDIPFATDEIVSDFTENVISIGFDVQNETINQEELKETQSTLEDSADNFTHTENTTDRPDSIIDENGSTVLFTYHDNGQHATIEVVRLDGSSQKSFYDKDGVICEEHTIDNGNSGITLYENGIIKLYSFTNTDGTSGEVYYNSDGVAINAKSNYPDGSWSELTYENGKPYVESFYGLTPEGHTVKNTFHPNGKVAETVDYYAHNDQELISRYDENGTLTETFGYDNYGRRIHTIYNADGTSVSVRTNEDGSTTVLD